MSKTKAAPSAAERESLDIRKIENGYIVSRSGEDAKGNYFRKEVFSPERPTVMMPEMAKPKVKGPASPGPVNKLMAMAKSSPARRR